MSEYGKIKKYFADKGYGFIEYKNKSGEDMFFHIKQVSSADEEHITERVEVEFDIGKGKNGRPQACNVKIVSRQTVANDHFFLPLDTRLLLNPFDADNLSLMINKAAYFDYKKNKFALEKLRDSISGSSTHGCGICSKDICLRQDEAIKGMGLITTGFEMSLDWRIVVGMGNPSVYETSMTFHHIYGIPYIPGTAIKGITRSITIAEYFKNIEGNEQDGALSDHDFCMIFGSPANSILGTRQGVVMFFDAYPVTEPILRLDVMNPHYSQYYSDKTGESPPTDDDKPKPITFLTVENTRFRFILGIKEKGNKPLSGVVFSGKKPLEEACSMLQKALSEHGIGAKTAAGYGYFIS